MHGKAHAIIAAEVSILHVANSLLSLLSVDELHQLVLLVLSSFVGSKLGSGVLDGSLLLGWIVSLEGLEHLLLKWGESGDFSDDLSNGDSSSGSSTLSGDRSVLPDALGGVGDVAVVHSYEHSTSVVGFSHVFYCLQVNNNNCDTLKARYNF
jgi:hypothetical protein